MLGGPFTSCATLIDEIFASFFTGFILKASHAKEIKASKGNQLFFVINRKYCKQ